VGGRRADEHAGPVPVAVILGTLAEVMEIEEAAQEYGISLEYVRAAIGYEARIVFSRRYLIQQIN
jgi:uncharacterized protein (DUF433 family)